MDIENVVLNELSLRTGVDYFGPSGGLPIAFEVPVVQGDNIAQGRTLPFPQIVVADYAGVLFAAQLIKHPTASTTSLLDSAGAPKAYYFIGTEDVYIRVTDEDQNGAPDAADTIDISLTTDGGDTETVTLTETGIDTGIFEGSIASLAGAANPGNGIIEANVNHILTATYTDPNDVADIS